MAAQATKNMPVELTLNILECACASIITATPSPPLASPLLNHFLHLRFVCKVFNRILMHSIQVEGQSIE
jgi:hypothetical protein